MKVILVLATILHIGWLQEAPEPFQVPDICTEMGPDQGTCGDYNVRWFFNPEDGQCKQFMYSGCGGNENNFKTLEDCEKMCKGRVRVDEKPEPASGDQDAAREAPSNVGEQVQELRPEANEPVHETAITDEEEPDSRDAEDDAGGDEDDLDDDEEDDELINKYLNVGDDLNVEDNQILKEAMAKFDVSVLKEETVEEYEDTNTEEHWDPQQQQQQQEEQQLRQEERNVQEHEEQLENKRAEEMMHLGAIDNREHQMQEEHREQLAQQQATGVQEHEEQTKNIEGEQTGHIEENGDIEQQPPQQQQQEQRAPQQQQQEQQAPQQQQQEQQAPQEFQEGRSQQEQQPEHEDEAVQMDEENNKQRNTEHEETNDNGTAADDHDDDHDEDDDDDGFMEDNGKDVETFFDELPTDMGPEDREMLLEGVAKFGATLLKAPEDIDDDMEIVPYGDEEAGQPNEEKDVPNDVEEAQRELEEAHRDLQEAHSDISDIGVTGREAPMTSSSEKSEDGKTPDGERSPRFRTDGARMVHPAPMNNPVLPGMPTQSPTKKITFMMPLLSFLNKRVPIAPTASPLHRSPMMMMMDRSNPRRRLSPSSAFSGREAVTAIRRTSLGMKTRREPTRPDSERTDEEARPPFSPLRYMIMRAMFKPMSRDPRSGSSRASQTKAMPSRVRILFPWLQPAKPASFQKQQPVPKLPIIRAPVDRSKMPLNRGFSPFREADTLEDNPQRVQGQSIFAPKIIRKSEFESFSHDNKHLNNVSPNNKFTLLQVFVNKHNGRQYFDDPSRRTRQSMAQTNNNNNNLPPTRLSPEPFNQAAKSFQPNYRQPMIYPVRTSPYQTYPTSSFWPEQMPHHYHPYLMPQGYPSQFARVPMPFGPSDSLGLPYNRRPAEVRPLPRRPIEVRPLLVTHRRNEVHAEGAKSRYCCMMPLAPGRCKSYQTKWYYNRDSGKCEIFYYTGCAGNANNFETWEECAATCLETSSAPRSTVPPHIMSRLSTPEESLEQEEREEEEGEDTQQETIIITSTRFPENEAEERQAMEEAKTVAPSVDQPISSTTERFEPVEKDENDEESDNGVLKEHQVVISEASLMSTHYIMLLAVITTVALAIIVLVSISSVHLCRKMRANKKEKILEAVIKQQLSTETPNIVYTTKPPSVEQTDKSQV